MHSTSFYTQSISPISQPQISSFSKSLQRIPQLSIPKKTIFTKTTTIPSPPHQAPPSSGRHQHRPAARLLRPRRRDPAAVPGQRRRALPGRRGAAGDRGGAHRGLQRAGAATVPWALLYSVWDRWWFIYIIYIVIFVYVFICVYIYIHKCVCVCF